MSYELERDKLIAAEVMHNEVARDPRTGQPHRKTRSTHTVNLNQKPWNTLGEMRLFLCESARSALLRLESEG